MATAAINGTTIHYELAGPVDGQPLVFVNGLLTDTRSWAAHLPVFVDDFHVLTYDSRGQGQSAKPVGPYPIELHTRDLSALLDHLGLAPVNCVGLSNGAAALLGLAIERPDLVRRLVIADGYSHVDAVMRAKLEAWLSAAQISSELRFLVATPYVWSNRFLEAKQELYSSFKEKAAAFPREAAIWLIAGAMEHDVRERLQEIEVPTLLVVGEEDILTPVSHAREIDQQLRRGRLHVIPQAGHAAPIERPDLFNPLVREFLTHKT